jgi:hypothetical protein
MFLSQNWVLSVRQAFAQITLDPETSYLKQVIQPEFEAAPSSITSNLLSALMAHQAGGRKGFASC